MTVAAPEGPLRISDLQGSRARRRKEGIIRALFFGAAGLAVLISLAIVLSLATEAVIFLTKVDIGQLFSGSWQPRSDSYDVTTLIVGTAVVAFIVAYASIAWLLRFVQSNSLRAFVSYRVVLGAAIIVALSAGWLSAT